jgi:hypothetical protein
MDGNSWFDADKRAETEALARFGRSSEWTWTMGAALAIPIICLTLVHLLGLNTDEPRVTRAISWTSALSVAIVWLVERSNMRKRNSWVDQRRREIMEELRRRENQQTG